MSLGSRFWFILLAWSCLPLPQILVILPKIAILGFCTYVLFSLTTRTSIWATTKTIKIFGFVTRCGVEAGSRALEQVKIFKPAPAFSFCFMPMIVAATATEHRSEGQRGFTQQREQGGGDDEDGDGDHAKVEDQDGRRHEPRKLTWNQILQQLQALKTEFYEIKNSKQTGDVDAETS